MENSPIFIGGLMKSGTSLLRKLISNHPNIYGGLETHWFVDDILKNWQNSMSNRQIWLRKFYDVSDSEFEVIKQKSVSGADFFNNFMTFCTQRANKKRWVEKTPDNILNMALIFEIWPDAKFIHVVRDYRDVFSSWKVNRDETLSEFIDKVLLINSKAEKKFGRKTNNYCEIDYYDLICATQQSLKTILEFLNEDWIEGLENYQGDNWDHEKVLEVTGKKSRTTQALAKPIFKSSIGQWKKVLSKEETQTIEKELHEKMVIWGWVE